MFKLTGEKYKALMFQIGTSKEGRGGRRKLPSVFTENGIAMLSGILNSDKAISVNISIMRIFTKLRCILMSNETISKKIEQLETDSKEMKEVFRIVFDKLNKLENKAPVLSAKRSKIGLK